MDKQKIILIGIFVVTIVIGVSAILISNLLSAPKSSPTTTTTVQIPSLSPTLYCTSTASNKSLTLTWNVPSGDMSTYTVSGQISDFSTQTQPTQFGPVPLTQGQYVFAQANGLDKYYASIYVQDAKGNKGTTTTSNQIDSSQCTTGSQPTPTIAQASTDTTAATTTTIAESATVTPTAAITSTPATSDLVCNNFTLTQNGTTLTSTTITPGTAVINIASGITSPTNAAISYASAKWSISPSIPALNVDTNGSSASWTPPVSSSNGSSFTITLSGVTDANGGSLTTPCTLNLALATGSLPNTAGNLPTLVMLITGMITTLIGSILLLKRQG